MRCSSQPATSHCETATIVRLCDCGQRAELLHLARTRQVVASPIKKDAPTERVYATSRSTAELLSLLLGAAHWRWLVAGLLGRPRRTPLVVNLQPAYCKLHVLSLVPACPISKRRIIVLFRLSLSKGCCRGPSGGSSSPPPCAFGLAV